MSSEQGTPSASAAMLVEMGQVKGQLSAIMELLRQNHAATQTRIEDLSKSVGQRFDGIEERLATLEQNERRTAIVASGAGAMGGAIVAAAVTALKGGFGS